MKPIEFKEQNIVFTKPESMTDKECCSLPAYKDDTEIISCWKLTFKERVKLLITGKLWFSILSQQQPPICLSVDTFFLKGGSEL